MEGYNACEDADSNMRAMALSKKYDLPCFGGSDSHKEDCAGFGYTILQDHISSETELIDYIRSGKATMIGGRHYMHTTKAKLGKVNNVLVYSFWIYNKFLALLRRKSRNFELMENQLLDTIRAGKRRDSRYIPLGDD